MSNCKLCPRQCGADRGERAGFCGGTDKTRIARAALHFYEEPCISGTKGSGAVFFSGCPLRCVYCQNRKIALMEYGKEISVERLCDIFFELRDQGANNINLVTPTHEVKNIIKAVKMAKDRGFDLPFVYNTSAYELPETLALLEGLVDVWLPDLKYFSPELSAKYSNAPDYFEVASRAITKMFEMAGTPVFGGPDGSLIKRGVIVRHLVLPGSTKDSKAVVKYLYETYGDDIFISIMNQYTPVIKGAEAERFPELTRRVTKREYDKVVDFAIELGVKNAYIQEGKTAEESFIPEFDGTGCV